MDTKPAFRFQSNCNAAEQNTTLTTTTRVGLRCRQLQREHTGRRHSRVTGWGLGAPRDLGAQDRPSATRADAQENHRDADDAQHVCERRVQEGKIARLEKSTLEDLKRDPEAVKSKAPPAPSMKVRRRAQSLRKPRGLDSRGGRSPQNPTSRQGPNLTFNSVGFLPEATRRKRPETPTLPSESH